jgi:putative methionine-R-sulfoxide reductase with GAF domain
LILGLAVVVILIAAMVPAYIKRLDERQQFTALETYQLQTSDGLGPVLDQLVNLAEAESVPSEHSRLHALVRASIESARHIAGQGRVRATYYRAYDQVGRNKAQLVPDGHTGRAKAPQSVFIRGTPAGDHVFKKLENNETIFVPDTSQASLPGWDAKRARDYETFICVPVRGSKKVYGMITVDSPKAGDLTENDVLFVKCIGLLLAAGVAVVNHPMGPRTTRRRSGQ